MKEVESEKEEKLREAACFGDAHAVRLLLKAGVVDVNSQHRMNKWTALHWAAKRNNPEIVKILIENGAEKLVENDKGQISVQLTTSDEVRVLLGGCVEEKQKQVVSKNETNWSSPQSDDSNKLKSGPAFFPSYMMDLNRKIDLSPILPKSDTMSSSERLDDLSNKIAFSDKMPKMFFVRIKKVGFDDDYVAISVSHDRLSLEHLVLMICSTFETSASDVIKIRRQIESRNVVVIDDVDVEKLPNETFLEVILKESATPVFPDLRVKI